MRHHPITRTSCSVTLSLIPASRMFALTLGPNPNPKPSPNPSPNPSPDPNSALASLTRLGIDNVLARIGVDRAGMVGFVRVCWGLLGSVRDRVRVRVRDTGVDRAGVRPVAQPHASTVSPNPEPLSLTLTPTLTPPTLPLTLTRRAARAHPRRAPAAGHRLELPPSYPPPPSCRPEAAYQ